jgi:hypothetical protein
VLAYWAFSGGAGAADENAVISYGILQIPLRGCCNTSIEYLLTASHNQSEQFNFFKKKPQLSQAGAFICP